MTLQEQAVDAAKKYIGINYRDLGRNIHGVDCVGYFKLFLSDIDYEFNPPNNYARNTTHPEELKREMGTWFDKLPNRLHYGHGDLALMREAYHPCHIGIIEIAAPLDHFILHACRLSKKVKRERIDFKRLRKIASVYRLREN